MTPMASSDDVDRTVRNSTEEMERRGRIRGKRAVDAMAMVHSSKATEEVCLRSEVRMMEFPASFPPYDGLTVNQT